MGIDPKHYDDVVDAFARLTLGLADLTSYSPGWHRTWALNDIGVRINTPGHPGYEESEAPRLDVTFRVIDTKDATENPATREELYEQMVLYFEERLQEMRKAT